MGKFTLHVTFEGDDPQELHSLFHGLQALANLPCRLDRIEASISDFRGEIMATLQETQAKLDALTTAVDAEHDQAAVVLQEVVDLKAQVAALQAQIAAGTGATPEQLDALNTSLDSILSKVQGIIPDAPVPAPTV